MKIETAFVPAFQPISITIETVDELAIITKLLGALNTDIEKHITNNPQTAGIPYEIYSQLDNLCEEKGVLMNDIDIEIA